MSRRTILIFSDWFLPGYRGGGPIRSLANLVAQVPAEFYVVTRITDHSSDIPYEGIEAGTWTVLNNHTKVCYLHEQDIDDALIDHFLDERAYDSIYLNSLFSALFTLLPLRRIKRRGISDKVILAPRGMLKTGALSVKPLKKKIFLLIATRSNHFGFRGITWHATNQAEADEIRSHFGDVRIHVAPNLPVIPEQPVSHPMKERGVLRLVTIARVSPEKGIRESVQFAIAAARYGKVILDIYGTQQNAAYLEECKQLAGRSPSVEIQFHGEVEPSAIPELLSKAHFFYMTTWGENYGHAIIESLIYGVPVIISDRTPWKGLSSVLAGWELPLEEASFAEVLMRCIEMEDHEYRNWCEGAFRLGLQHAADPVSLESCMRLFGISQEYFITA